MGKKKRTEDDMYFPGQTAHYSCAVVNNSFVFYKDAINMAFFVICVSYFQNVVFYDIYNYKQYDKQPRITRERYASDVK